MAKVPTRRTSRQQTSPEQEFVEGLFRGLGQIISWAFKQLTKGNTGTKKVSNRAEIEKLQEHWQDVELYILQTPTLATAVSEADKILDTAFKLLGFTGETMADRLRSAEAKLGSDLYQRVWEAHKLRNTLAHEVGAKVSAQQATEAVTSFRQALYQLGVLS